jgi:hypothetical protein
LNNYNPIDDLNFDSAFQSYESNQLNYDDDILNNLKFFMKDCNLKANFHIIVLWNYALRIIESIVKTYDK